MSTYIIYKLVFPNNKVYVGQTAQKLKRRLSAHKCYSKCGNTVLSNAIRKYGWGSIKQEVICTVSEEFVDDVERYFIKEFNSLVKNGKGYNIEDGGNKNKHLSEETRKKQRIKKLGIKQSIEHIANKQKGNFKPIIMYTKDNNFVKEYNSVIEATSELNNKHVSDVLTGKRKYAGGYTFKYKRIV